MTAGHIVGVHGLVPYVELGLGDARIPVGTSAWDNAGWDATNSTWGGGYVLADPTWVDITCFVHDIEITTGRDRTIDRWQVGAASITLNNASGWADVQPADMDPTDLEVRPGRQIRFGASVDGGPTLWMYRWFIDGMTPAYDPVAHDVVTLNCVDTKGQAGKVAVEALPAPVGAGDTVPERLDRILDAGRWSPAARLFDPSSVVVTETSLGSQTVDLLDQTADSAAGVIHADAHGRLVFKAGTWQYWYSDDPPDATIGNGPTVTNDIVEAGDQTTWFGDNLVWGASVIGDEVCPTGWELSWELADIATRVIVAREGGDPVTFDDEPNQVRYGVETFTRTDLICVADEQVHDIGYRLAASLSANYMPNIAAVSLDAATSVGARDICVTADPTIPSRYRCRLYRPGGRIVFDRQFLATGIQHRIAPDGWQTRIALDDAAPYQITPGSFWDAAIWDHDTWLIGAS